MPIVRFLQDRMGFRKGTEVSVGEGIAKTLVATKGAEIIDDAAANKPKKNVKSKRASGDSGGSEAGPKTSGQRQQSRRSAKRVDSSGD